MCKISVNEWQHVCEPTPVYHASSLVLVKVKKAAAPREIQHHMKWMGCHITSAKIVQRTQNFPLHCIAISDCYIFFQTII